MPLLSSELLYDPVREEKHGDEWGFHKSGRKITLVLKNRFGTVPGKSHLPINVDQANCCELVVPESFFLCHGDIAEHSTCTADTF